MSAEPLWLSAVAAVAVLAAVLVLRWRRAAAAKGAERAFRPPALRDATLAHMEKLFRVRSPVSLVARVDRAYRRPDGELVLVELKTRRSDRAYATDVIQLSAQKMALEGQTGQHVADHGFVTVQRPKGTAAPRSHRSRTAGRVEDRRALQAARGHYRRPTHASVCGLEQRLQRLCVSVAVRQGWQVARRQSGPRRVLRCWSGTAGRSPSGAPAARTYVPVLERMPTTLNGSPRLIAPSMFAQRCRAVLRSSK